MRRKYFFARYTAVLFLILFPIYLYSHVPIPTSHCLASHIERNVDNHHRDINRNYWNQLSELSIGRYKDGWKTFVEKERKMPLPEWIELQGIVFVAGNDDTLKRTMGTIRLLRQVFHCVLPIEIWHMEHEADAAGLFEKEVQKFKHVQLRDLSDVGLVKAISRRRNIGKQFQVKAAAIINSRFQHVLFLDSDNIPTRDPSFLFDTVEYKEKGAIFWPDFWKTATENKIFKILEIECQDVWEQESGQIVIDKRRHWIPLQLAWYMQYYHELYFKLLNGDKDTFQYAWRALNAPFYRIKTFVGMGGLLVKGRFCGHSMLQYMDGYDQPLFVHANLMKQMPKSVFLQNDTERPWHLIKRDDQSLILPQFYMANDTLGCMDFMDSSSIKEFDKALDGFQDFYFESGGIGGYT